MTDSDSIYVRPYDIAVWYFDNMRPYDKDYILGVKSPDDMVQFHNTVGRYIRNKYRLWDEGNPYTKADAAPNAEGVIDDPLHPDQVSDYILRVVWQLVHTEADIKNDRGSGVGAGSANTAATPVDPDIATRDDVASKFLSFLIAMNRAEENGYVVDFSIDEIKTPTKTLRTGTCRVFREI